MGLKEDEPIEHRWITSSIENAQVKVEGHNFNARKNLLEYDDVMNLQRKAVYEQRRKALEGDGVREMIIDAINNLVDDIIDECIPEGGHPEVWDISKLRKRLTEIFDLNWEESDDEVRDFALAEIRARIQSESLARYEAQESRVGGETMRQVERMLLLQLTDQYWKDHLLAMDRMRTGIGLRGYGQKNPLLEYKKEGTSMFLMMNSMRDEAVIARLLRMEFGEDGLEDAPNKNTARRLVEGEIGSPPPPPPPAATPPAAPAPGQQIITMAQMQAAVRAAQAAQAQRQAQEAAAAAPPAAPAPGIETREWALARGIRRNDPCPCGSGLKFKKCCYRAVGEGEGEAEGEGPSEEGADSSSLGAAAEGPAPAAGEELSPSEGDDSSAPAEPETTPA